MSYDVHKDDRFIVEGLNKELNDYLANEKQIKFERICEGFIRGRKIKLYK